MPVYQQLNTVLRLFPKISKGIEIIRSNWNYSGNYSGIIPNSWNIPVQTSVTSTSATQDNLNRYHYLIQNSYRKEAEQNEYGTAVNRYYFLFRQTKKSAYIPEEWAKND